jgi:8-amino-7-oxononanoate synthase
LGIRPLNTLADLLGERWEQSGGSHRHLRAVEQYGPRELRVAESSGSRRLLNFSSNDYLSLSQLPHHGKLSSQPSSRLLGGNELQLEAWEADVATHWKQGSALFFPTGYMANVGVMSCLPKKSDLVLMDRLCHASLIDGVRLSPADWKRYRHLDMQHLEKLLKQHQHKREGDAGGRASDGAVWVVTESVFSMDGDCPDVEALRDLKQRYGFYLIADEAHAIGVTGKRGRGWFEACDGLDLVDVLVFNFSKALAMQGGCVCGVPELKRHLVAHSRPQIYSTATPASHWSALPERLAALADANAERQHLRSLKQQLAEGLGLTCSGPSAIVPVLLGDGQRAIEAFEHLWQSGLYCPAVLPPTVPKGQSRLRLSLNTSHQSSDIERLIDSLKPWL